MDPREELRQKIAEIAQATYEESLTADGSTVTRRITDG